MSLVYGVSPAEVHFSIWKIIDAVHKTPSLNIEFPTSHLKEKEIAKSFEKISIAGFSNCCGYIYGLLI